MSYDPNQPREPKGTSTGGQWTSYDLDKATRAAIEGANLTPEEYKLFSIGRAAGQAGQRVREDAVMEYLNKMETASPENTSEGYVARNGRFYTPTLLPDSIGMGVKGECYENAAKLSETEGLEYVEGFASQGSLNFAVHHAWVVDSKGNVYDNTWDIVGPAYLGVEFTRKDLLYVIKSSGSYGIIFYCKESFKELAGDK